MYNFELKRESDVILSNNIGSFYKFVNKRMSCKHGIGALTKHDGGYATGDADRANLLNNFFSSVCTIDNGVIPDFDSVAGDNVTLDHVEFSREAVLRTVKQLKMNGSCGPDGLPPLLYKNLAQCISEPLALMFDSFMSVGRIPDEWRRAFVTPIYKGGLAADVSNYRPISLTCVACKIMERVITRRILFYLHEHRLISNEQYGFLSGRSTTLNLLDALNDWTLAINNKHSVAVAYIDYAKAFDTVSSVKLHHKLKAYGITGNLLLWIKDFLTGRTQQTRVGNALSEVKALTSGVIQGSCLGPILFVLYINDIVGVFSNSIMCKLYADDVKMYTVVETDIDCRMLQQALDRLQEWSDKWQLKISYKNAPYCKLVIVLNFQVIIICVASAYLKCKHVKIWALLSTSVLRSQLTLITLLPGLTLEPVLFANVFSPEIAIL
jgi:hypothetical protein